MRIGNGWLAALALLAPPLRADGVETVPGIGILPTRQGGPEHPANGDAATGLQLRVGYRPSFAPSGRP